MKDRLRARPTQPNAPLRAVDLFCGAGGLSEGLRQAGFDVVAAADHDPDGCATYRQNFPETGVIEGDLTDSERHRALLGAAGEETLDLLAGGPPCQAFSQIHNHDRLLEDPRNRLYREFVELLAELRPRALVLENVPGMNQLAGGAVRRQIAEDLSLGGAYEIVSGVLDAGDFGVPQRRPRLVFIGVDCELGAPELPAETGVTRLLHNGRGGQLADVASENARYWHEVLRDPHDARVVTASQALSDLLAPGGEYTTGPDSAYQRMIRQGSAGPQDHEPSRTRDDTAARLEAIPPGGNVYDLPERLLARYLGDTKWGPAGDGNRLARRHYYAYRRLHPDWLAWTVNTKADFAYHYGLARGLSVREAARLQGFPDRFHVMTAPRGTPGQYKNGARHSRYRQIGNAVPPAAGRRDRERSGRGLEQAERATDSLCRCRMSPDQGPFSHPNRLALVDRYFGGRSVDPAEAWKDIYRLLLWCDPTTGLAHCYESDKAQPGRPWYARTLAFHDWLGDQLGLANDELPDALDWMFRQVITQVAAEESARRAGQATKAEAQREPYDLMMPEPGEDPELRSIIEPLLPRDPTERPDDDVIRDVLQKVRTHIGSENKRRNLLGRGFEDVLAGVLSRLQGGAPADFGRHRRRLMRFRAFVPCEPATRSSE